MNRLKWLLAAPLLFACQNEESLLQKDAETLTSLTGGAGNLKRWKIESATLTNSFKPKGMSIGTLANVKDDEFIFESEPANANKVVFTWQTRNEIRTSASSTKMALLDYYRSAIQKIICIQSDGSIVTGDPNVKMELVSDRIKLDITKGNASLHFELTTENEDTGELAGSLNFNQLTTVSGKGIEQAAGFVGSEASNSLYIAYRSLEGSQPEKIIRYGIDDGTVLTQEFEKSDFVTKEAHIINDELKIVGARFVNTYSLDLSREPVSVAHNLTLSRYGSTVVDHEVFLFGGDLLNTAKANAVYKHDQQSGLLNEVGTLPEPRFWAHGEIVDDKLFVFGGRQSFTSAEAEDDIFIFDLTNKSTQTLKLPKPLHRTFAARFEHLIFVAGQREIGVQNWETSFGVFNTHDNSYQELPSSLPTNGKETVYGITIIGSNMYILYGATDTSSFGIYSASLP